MSVDSSDDKLRQVEHHLEDDVCIHIFTASAAMVGVCLTVIGLFRVNQSLSTVASLGDELLAADALLFLGACGLSYWALRTRRRQRRHRVERVADGVFLAALSLMAAVCTLVAYEFL